MIEEAGVRCTVMDDINEWAAGSAKRCELHYQIDQINVSVCMQRSYEVFSSRSSRVIPHQIRIFPNHFKIQEIFCTLFHDALNDQNPLNTLPSPENEPFMIHFFASRQDLVLDELAIKKRDKSLKRPTFRYILFYLKGLCVFGSSKTIKGSNFIVQSDITGGHILQSNGVFSGKR